MAARHHAGEPPAGHSPLGASAASRFMACPASVGLSYSVIDEESDAAALGTAAHTLAATCLTTGDATWQWIGEPLTEEITVDLEMAEAVQKYLDAVAEWHPERNQGNTWIERRFHVLRFHKYFYGTADLVHWDKDERTLHVWDYKHGFLLVEVERNVQCMYYAAGALESLSFWEACDKIVLHIAQPRGFHWKGDIRHWETTPNEIAEWLETELLPAMDATLDPALRNTTVSGEHCRFCPARKRACPQLIADTERYIAMMEEFAGRTAPEYTSEQLAKIGEAGDLFKIVHPAVIGEMFKRASNGVAIPGWKLVKARSNRVWRDGAEDALKKKLGAKAYETKLKSPAQIDEMISGAKLTAEHAFSPDKGLTLARDKDGRASVNKSTKSMFAPVPKKGAK